jgi:hypothetical protein
MLEKLKRTEVSSSCPVNFFGLHAQAFSFHSNQGNFRI